MGLKRFGAFVIPSRGCVRSACAVSLNRHVTKTLRTLASWELLVYSTPSQINCAVSLTANTNDNLSATFNANLFTDPIATDKTTKLCPRLSAVSTSASVVLVPARRTVAPTTHR